MKTRVETMTPRKAEKMLEKHWVKEHQRRPSKSVVDSYARTMRSGQWLLTHQGIAIDDRDELMDGLHRLLAVIESGCQIPMMVTRGIANNGGDSDIHTIDAIDRGLPRYVGQQLGLRHGISNGKLVAAICRGILWLCCLSRKKLVGRFNVANALQVLERDHYGKVVQAVLDGRSQDYRIRNASVCAAAAFAMKAYPTMARDFYSKLAMGEGLKASDPAMKCRRWLQSAVPMRRMKAGDGRGHRADPRTLVRHDSSQLTEYRAILTCAMKHVLGETTTKIYINDHGYNFFLEKQRATVESLLAACGYSEEES